MVPLRNTPSSASTNRLRAVFLCPTNPQRVQVLLTLKNHEQIHLAGLGGYFLLAGVCRFHANSWLRSSSHHHVLHESVYPHFAGVARVDQRQAIALHF